MHEMGPWEPKLYIFGNQLYSKNIKKLRLYDSSIFILENILHHNFTWNGLNSRETVVI